MKWTRKDLILQAKSSCAYQDDLSCDSIKRKGIYIGNCGIELIGDPGFFCNAD